MTKRVCFFLDYAVGCPFFIRPSAVISRVVCLTPVLMPQTGSLFAHRMVKCRPHGGKVVDAMEDEVEAVHTKPAIGNPVSGMVQHIPTRVPLPLSPDRPYLRKID